MQQKLCGKKQSEQHFKRTNERMKENNDKKKDVENNQQRPSIHRMEQQRHQWQWQYTGNVYMTRYEKGTARSNTKFIQNRVLTLFAYSDLVELWMYRQPIFFSVRLVLYGINVGFEYRIVVMPKLTLYTLSSYTNDGVSVLSSTHIFSIQYKFCGAVVASLLQL